MLKVWYSRAQKSPDYAYNRTRDPVTGIPQVLGKKFMGSMEWNRELIGFNAEYQLLNDFFVFIEVEKQTVTGNYQRYNSEYYQGNLLTFSFGMNVGF